MDRPPSPLHEQWGRETLPAHLRSGAGPPIAHLRSGAGCRPAAGHSPRRSPQPGCRSGCGSWWPEPPGGCRSWSRGSRGTRGRSPPLPRRLARDEGSPSAGSARGVRHPPIPEPPPRVRGPEAASPLTWGGGARLRRGDGCCWGDESKCHDIPKPPGPCAWAGSGPLGWGGGTHGPMGQRGWRWGGGCDPWQGRGDRDGGDPQQGRGNGAVTHGMTWRWGCDPWQRGQGWGCDPQRDIGTGL